jgi:hypothetical protein
MDKGLISRIYKEPPMLNTKITSKPINNGQEGCVIFRRSTNGKGMYEEMSSILSYKEMKIKITLRFFLTPVRRATIKKTIKKNKQMLRKMWRNRNLYTLLVGT